MKKTLLLIPLMLCGCASSPSQSVQTEMTTTLVTTVTSAEQTTSEQTSETSTETTAAETTTTEYVPVYPDFEDTPANAYERLLISFADEHGNEAAPDDYAGVYSYFGKMYVCITTDSPSDTYTDLLDEYTCVSYKTVTHSFNELTDTAKKAADILGRDYSVKQFLVDVPSNKAQVIVSEGDPVEMRTKLEEQGFAVDLLEITIQEDT